MRDIWPSQKDINDTIASAINTEMFTKNYADVFKGDERWRNLPTPSGNTFEWDENSTYVRKPPYFDGMPAEPEPVTDISGARVLALLGDSVTTDHISPAGNIKAGTPAAQYLDEHGVDKANYNSYGSRRGNHEVMIRGTFAKHPAAQSAARRRLRWLHPRLHQRRRTGVHLRRCAELCGGGHSAGRARRQGIRLGLVARLGGQGHQPAGVRAVITESFERIHRSNLIGMGVIPLQFPEGESAASLKLDGTETFDITGIEALNDGKRAEDRAGEGHQGGRQGRGVRRRRAHRHPR
jgi:aconitate hydratase